MGLETGVAVDDFMGFGCGREIPDRFFSHRLPWLELERTLHRSRTELAKLPYVSIECVCSRGLKPTLMPDLPRPTDWPSGKDASHGDQVTGRPHRGDGARVR